VRRVTEAVFVRHDCSVAIAGFPDDTDSMIAMPAVTDYA
jgi:hypothetical protein